MIGIVLVSKDWYYLDENGELPTRPSFDKDLLLGLCTGLDYICSDNTEKELPASLRQRLGIKSLTPEINLGIKTFKEYPPDIFFVVKSKQALHNGKKFDLKWLCNNYRSIYETTELMILRRRNGQVD